MIPRHLVVALQFLTRLPTPRLAKPEPGDLTRAASYFPIVGAVIGLVLALAHGLTTYAGSWPAAIVVLLAWVWVTGALHLDGLGDVADALGAAHSNPGRFEAVLDDPHAGNFAIVAIGLQLAAKLVLVAHIPTAYAVAALVLIPAWARWGAMVWSLLVPPLKSGLGESFRSEISRPATAVSGAVLAAVSLWLAPPLLSALVFVPVIALYWLRRLGGISGDCLGASVEVTESLLLAALVLAAPFGFQ